MHIQAYALALLNLVGILIDAAYVSVSDKRYCEVLYVKNINGTTIADVYNTFGLNSCPASLWNSITPANAKDATSVAVILNGPRYWTVDQFGPSTSSIVQDKVYKIVGGINMSLAARVPVQLPLTSPKIYAPSTVSRNVDFWWRAGTTAYFLTNKLTGDKYIMQSYSQQIDTNLTMSELWKVGSRLLMLPPQWTFSAVVLQSDFNVTTPALVGGKATVALVLQDELANSYSFAGDLDAYLAPKKPCTPISVSGDATYCISSTLPLCSGDGRASAGTACPRKGDLAIGDCWPYLTSYNGSLCVAPRDATCQLLLSGAWGCAWP